jgi:hypothetical protein
LISQARCHTTTETKLEVWILITRVATWFKKLFEAFVQRKTTGVKMTGVKMTEVKMTEVKTLWKDKTNEMVRG